MAGDEDDLPGLRAQHEADEAEIADLRRRLRAETDRADEAVEAAGRGERLIERLRTEAGIRTAALDEVREALDAAEAELGDLRAVRDALTPPQLPACAGLDLDATFLPATHRVSGDFYLAARGPSPDVTVVVVGDVAGKGIEAAREAAFVRTAFATTAPFSDDPCQLLDWVNAALLEREGYAERFVTVACLTFDAGTRRVRWGLAGHPPPLRMDTGMELEGARHGLPLGVQEVVGCVEGSTQLAAGQGLLLYTDGLVEARADGQMLGVERAGALVRERAAEPAADVLAALRAAVEAYGQELGDDLCLLALRAR